MIVVAAACAPTFAVFHVTRRSGSLVFGWNEAVLSLSSLAQSRDFGINVALKFKFRLGEFGHGLHIVVLLTASLLVTQPRCRP
jgi:hypothetical protein